MKNIDLHFDSDGTAVLSPRSAPDGTPDLRLSPEDIKSIAAIQRQMLKIHDSK